MIKYFVCESSKCIIMGNMEAGVGGSYMKDVMGSFPVQAEDCAYFSRPHVEG